MLRAALRRGDNNLVIFGTNSFQLPPEMAIKNIELKTSAVAAWGCKLTENKTTVRIGTDC